jgi:hypothetical protein
MFSGDLSRWVNSSFITQNLHLFQEQDLLPHMVSGQMIEDVIVGRN